MRYFQNKNCYQDILFREGELIMTRKNESLLKKCFNGLKQFKEKKQNIKNHYLRKSCFEHRIRSSKEECHLKDLQLANCYNDECNDLLDQYQDIFGRCCELDQLNGCLDDVCDDTGVVFDDVTEDQLDDCIDACIEILGYALIPIVACHPKSLSIDKIPCCQNICDDNIFAEGKKKCRNELFGGTIGKVNASKKDLEKLAENLNDAFGEQINFEVYNKRIIGSSYDNGKEFVFEIAEIGNRKLVVMVKKDSKKIDEVDGLTLKNIEDEVRYLIDIHLSNRASSTRSEKPIRNKISAEKDYDDKVKDFNKSKSRHSGGDWRINSITSKNWQPAFVSEI